MQMSAYQVPLLFLLARPVRASQILLAAGLLLPIPARRPIASDRITPDDVRVATHRAAALARDIMIPLRSDAA